MDNDDYKKYIRENLDKLRPVFARAAIGDFSADIEIPDADDDLAELFTGIAMILETAREESNKRKQVNDALEQRVNDLKKTQKALINVNEDLESAKIAAEQDKLRYQSLLASIRDGLFAVDKNGIVTIINEPAEKMFNVDADDVIGRPYHEVLPMQNNKGELLGEENRPLQQALSTGKVTKISVEEPFFYVRSDGTKFPTAVTASPILYEGITIGALNLFRDITKEHELDRAKNEFISIASHQLRTPLTGIFWVVERFLKTEELSKKGKEYLDDISHSARRLAELVDALLNVSRIEGDALAIRPETFDLTETISNQISEYSPLCQEKNVNISFTEHPETLSITTDKNALDNIVHAVLSNAVEYTDKNGSIFLTLDAQEDNAIITITDTGIGIPKKDQKRIFQKFTRAENAESIKPGGTGLGLYIATNAARLIDGEIWFESPPEDQERGTRFYVKLPLELEKQAEGKPLI